MATRTEFNRRLNGKKLILPPIAGYTDYPYRRILSEYKPPMICTEMINAKAATRNSPRTIKMLTLTEGTHLNGVQLFGADPMTMERAAETVESMGYDYIDINMGCTISTITDTGAGIALMKDEEKATEIASKIVEAVNTPVTCKLRLGPTQSNKNAASLSTRLAEAGIAAVTIHGRTGEKRFGQPVDVEGVRQVVETVGIPVIANGGVYTGDDAVRLLQSTGATAVMPGRGIIGNPWLITEIQSKLSGVSFEVPSLEEKKKVARIHLYYLCMFYGEPTGVINMRRILHRYFTGCNHLSDLKRDIVNVTTVEQIHALVDRIQEKDGELYFA